jgi:tRNA1Val (adenine37-N6)-methyltransferase
MATLSGGLLVDEAAQEATKDALFGGSLVLFQPPRGAGYRTNVDALLLAGFATTPSPAPLGPSASPQRPPGIAFDLGAGVGAVGLALLRFGAARRVVFVEIEEGPAAMARRNLDANGWASRGEVIRGDVRDVARAHAGQATLVVCNPPYTRPGAGRASPNEQRARVGELGHFIQAARQVAGKRARVCFVYPAHELATLLSELTSAGLHAKRIRFVHSTAAAPARIALVEAQAGRSGGLRVIAPLVEREARGYTPELESLLARG